MSRLLSETWRGLDSNQETLSPISCLLLTHYQMFQECCPLIKVEDGPKEVQAAKDTSRVSQGESLSIDFIIIEGTAESLDCESTQGVDLLHF